MKILNYIGSEGNKLKDKIYYYYRIYLFEKDSIYRINKIVNNYPIAWEHCARIIEILVPAIKQFGASGTVQWLREIVTKELKKINIYGIINI